MGPIYIYISFFFLFLPLILIPSTDGHCPTQRCSPRLIHAAPPAPSCCPAVRPRASSASCTSSSPRLCAALFLPFFAGSGRASVRTVELEAKLAAMVRLGPDLARMVAAWLEHAPTATQGQSLHDKAGVRFRSSRGEDGSHGSGRPRPRSSSSSTPAATPLLPHASPLRQASHPTWDDSTRSKKRDVESRNLPRICQVGCPCLQ